MTNRVTFPILRALMAKYGLSYADMGRIIPNKITGQPMSYQTFSTKINKEFNFDAREMILIRDYFNSLGENVTVQEIFFDWLSSNEDIARKWNLNKCKKKESYEGGE